MNLGQAMLDLYSTDWQWGCFFPPLITQKCTHECLAFNHKLNLQFCFTCTQVVLRLCSKQLHIYVYWSEMSSPCRQIVKACEFLEMEVPALFPAKDKASCNPIMLQMLHILLFFNVLVRDATAAHNTTSADTWLCQLNLTSYARTAQLIHAILLAQRPVTHIAIHFIIHNHCFL